MGAQFETLAVDGERVREIKYISCLTILGNIYVRVYDFRVGRTLLGNTLLLFLYFTPVFNKHYFFSWKNELKNLKWPVLPNAPFCVSNNGSNSNHHHHVLTAYHMPALHGISYMHYLISSDLAQLLQLLASTFSVALKKETRISVNNKLLRLPNHQTVLVFYCIAHSASLSA